MNARKWLTRRPVRLAVKVAVVALGVSWCGSAPQSLVGPAGESVVRVWNDWIVVVLGPAPHDRPCLASVPEAPASEDVVVRVTRALGCGEADLEPLRAELEAQLNRIGAYPPAPAERLYDLHRLLAAVREHTGDLDGARESRERAGAYFGHVVRARPGPDRHRMAAVAPQDTGPEQSMDHLHGRESVVLR